MMSAPAINSLPPSGNQTTKMNSSSTANPSVTPIGLSVSPKLSVIPSSQISAAQTKSPTGVNHSSVPLSLVYENKVSGSQQAQSSAAKSPSDKPKDLSPAKPTSNGVETTCNKSPSQSQVTSPAQVAPTNQSASTTQPAQLNQSTSVTSASNKTDETPSSQQPGNSNSSEKKASSTEGTNELPTPKEESGQKPIVPPPTNMTTTDEKVEQNKDQTPSTQESKGDTKATKKESSETVTPKEEPGTDTNKPDTAASKPPAPSQPSKRKREPKVPEKKTEESEPEPEKKPRRIRSQVLPYQSPLPELATFISKSLKEKDATQKNNEEKLIVFYKNEFLAVRNAEGGFYLCQTLQNVYRSSHRIRIRWLSQDKEKSNEEGDIYTPDFYDLTDFECILTTVALNKTDKNMYKLQKVELERIENILKRALDVEKGVTEKPSITEEHPDGIDLSLYKDESQLQKSKKGSKRAASSPSRKSPKQAKKEEPVDAEKTPKRAVTVGKRRNVKPAKKAVKSTPDKSKVKKRGAGKPDSKPSKAVDQLKVSPPNEKARVVAKVLRKVDIVPTKESTSKKQAKSKPAKRSQDMLKDKKKKPLKGGAKKPNQKEESLSSHNEKKQTKTKHSNNKNKKN